MRRRWLWVSLLASLALAVGVVLVVAPSSDPAASDVRERENMTLGQAALLGVVEGVTEFLPVSSTGHLLVVQRALRIGVGGDNAKLAADAFAICIQAGAILAILGLYFARLRQMVLGLFGRDAGGLRLLLAVSVAFLPAAVLGLTAGEWIRSHLFGPWPIVWAWGVGGVAILLEAWRKHEATEEGRAGIELEQITLRAALLIGLVQCIAMWPGVSRSLVTIVGGRVVGLSLRAAVEFSFLLGLLTLGAATAYDILRHGDLLLSTYSPAAMVMGACCAFLSAVLAVQWMVQYLQKHSLQIFGWYRIAIALVVGGLLLAGAL